MIKSVLWLGLVCLMAVFQAHGQKQSVHEPAAIRSTDDLATRYIQFQSDYLPIITPSADRMFLQPAAPLLPFDQTGFGKRFLKNLVGTAHPVSGAPIYTIYAMEDAQTCETIIFNCDLKELARIPRAPTYDPDAWALGKYGASATPHLLALYNPARMIGEFQIIPSEYYVGHMAALEQQAALEAAAMPMMMSMAPPPPDGSSSGGTGSVTFVSGTGTNGSIVSMTADSNSVVTVAITVPEHFGGGHLEIFSKDNLVYSLGWNIAKSWLPTYGEPTVSWTDPSTGIKDACYYIISDADDDADGDGYSRLRELIFETDGNGPDVFDAVDEDGDGMHDWYEILLFGNTNQSPNGDFDGDLLLNNEEMVFESGASAPPAFHSDPCLADTDGDGMDDFLETYTYSFLNPLDASDADYDQDGLSNAEEHSGITELDNWDTDGDTLPDGWEIAWNLDPVQYNDPTADPDGDGVTSLGEYLHGSNPLAVDTDGDGTNDLAEIEQGSSPSSSTDLGVAPNSNDLKEVTFSLQDDLTGERFEMEIKGERTVRIRSAAPGEADAWETHTFLNGQTYAVSIRHLEGSHKTYYARIVTEGGVVIEDPNNIFQNGTIANPANTAKMHLPKITLVASKNEMTLKHNNQCALSMVTEPAGVEFSDHEFEIQFQNAYPDVWRELGTGNTMDWTTRVAGKFNLRAKATAGGEETVLSEEIQATIQFPNVYEVKYDAGIASAMEAAWQQTLIDSTPTSYREHGFLIRLDTRTDTYIADSSVYTASTGTPGSLVFGEYWFNFENSEEINPTSTGANYPIALFHTHPPYTYAPLGKSRYTGESSYDIDGAEQYDLPGLLYDYSANEIQSGHAETNDYKCYEYGPLRRSTP